MDDVNIVSISATAYKHHIDNSTASAYCAIVYKMPSKTDCEFVSAINQRAEICKMMRSIGSFTLSDTPCELFSDKIIGQLEELEDQICNILGPEAVSQVKDKISNVQANCGKGFNQNHSTSAISTIYYLSHNHLRQLFTPLLSSSCSTFAYLIYSE